MICSEQEYSYGLQLLNILAEHLEYVTVCPAPHDSATCSALQATFVVQHELLDQELRRYEARSCTAPREPLAFAARYVSDRPRGMMLTGVPRDKAEKAERFLALATEQVDRIEVHLTTAQSQFQELGQVEPFNHQGLDGARTELANYSELLSAWAAYRDKLAQDAGGSAQSH
ncbi:MAG: hypothetical protein JWO59_348 [Chloroflexi bacterium]|nr:hypothetical protein [Chloroflexota bacterium]